MKITFTTQPPDGSTHVFHSTPYCTTGGFFKLHLVFYKKTGKQWYRYTTDNDNEYPEWIKTLEPHPSSVKALKK